MLEAVAQNRDITRATFGLHAGAVGWLGFTVADDAVDHDAPMATDQVDRGATARAPALDGAALDAKIAEAGELDAVLIAGRADVTCDESAQDDVVRTGVSFGEAPAVVDV